MIQGKNQSFKINEEGGVEFDVILKEKPESNVFEFPIQAKGLKFYYQPALDPNHPTWADTDSDGEPDTFQPENVVGSYAVYHETNKDHILGGTNYKTGKAFHIYRPKVIDAVGNEIWGILNMDEMNKTLTVTIDEAWLENAIYPVTIDPTFGYTAAGLSYSCGANVIQGSNFTGFSGTLDMISAYAYDDNAAHPKFKPAIYLHSDSSFVAGGAEIIGTLSGFHWYNHTVSGSPSISAVEYVLVDWGSGAFACGPNYDAGVTNQGNTQSLAYGTWPNPATFSHNNLKYSVYATYTAGGGADLLITQANISFSYAASSIETGEVKEGVNVTINAMVYNNGTGNASSVKVNFYDGSPAVGNNIANTTISSIAAGVSQNATVYWNSLAGTHNISIKVDPDNTITESNETNNNASKLINVSAWQKYYGNISGNMALKDQPGNSFQNWTWGSLSGTVFITNVSSLNFSNLQALGRNKTGGIAQNNFSRADMLLNLTPGSNNTTGFINNNITQLFSSDGTNPRNTSSFTIYGNTINNVAIVNSTNVTNLASMENATFLTGILWDTTWDSNGNYGDEGEKLVYVTNINTGKTGLTTTPHDYEIAIPSSLKGAGVVYFYTELK